MAGGVGTCGKMWENVAGVMACGRVMGSCGRVWGHIAGGWGM